MGATKVKSDDKELRETSERYENLKRELAALATKIGFVLTGSVQSRFFECTRDNGCRCHDDPAHRHGPYHYWTRTQNKKTVTVGVSDEDLETYQGWWENTRALERVVNDMRQESLRVMALMLGKDEGDRPRKGRRQRRP